MYFSDLPVNDNLLTFTFVGNRLTFSAHNNHDYVFRPLEFYLSSLLHYNENPNAAGATMTTRATTSATESKWRRHRWVSSLKAVIDEGNLFSYARRRKEKKIMTSICIVSTPKTIPTPSHGYKSTREKVKKKNKISAITRYLQYKYPHLPKLSEKWPPKKWRFTRGAAFYLNYHSLSRRTKRSGIGYCKPSRRAFNLFDSSREGLKEARIHLFGKGFEKFSEILCR